jgi:hypothetical protein
VASGWVASWACKAASCSGPIVGRAPGGGFARRSPPARLVASHRFRLARLTPNAATTSGRAIPRSTAATARSRRSLLYALIPRVSQLAQLPCPPL